MNPAETRAEVEVENVSKTFPGTRALRGVHLALEKGEVHALVGQNGSGKSTLIKILSGYHEPDAGGKVWVRGEPIDSDRAATAHRLGLRFVHQGLGLIDQLDTVENVALGAGYLKRRSGGIAWTKERRRVRELLNRFGVDVDLTVPVAKLDPVERTAIAIARALIDADPHGGALVLDEPTVALSVREVERLFELIREVSRGGVSVLYVSHYLAEVFAIADRVSVLRGGRLVLTEDVKALARRDLVRHMVGTDIDLSLEHDVPAPESDRGVPALRVQRLAARELKGVTFDIHPGEVVGVAGLQGSGIGELAYAIIGHAKATGEVAVSGAPMSRRSPLSMREAGVVLVPRDRQQEGAIIPFLVRENLTLGQLAALRRSGRVSRQRERDLVERWIDELEISPPDGEREYTTLSGGNQQKVVLGKWLSMTPSVLLLDEPTNGVDVGARLKIYTTILEKAVQGLAVLICSSDAAELAEICTRVIVLARGEIVAQLHGPDVSESAILHEMASLAA